MTDYKQHQRIDSDVLGLNISVFEKRTKDGPILGKIHYRRRQLVHCNSLNFFFERLRNTKYLFGKYGRRNVRAFYYIAIQEHQNIFDRYTVIVVYASRIFLYLRARRGRALCHLSCPGPDWLVAKAHQLLGEAHSCKPAENTAKYLWHLSSSLGRLFINIAKTLLHSKTSSFAWFAINFLKAGIVRLGRTKIGASCGISWRFQPNFGEGAFSKNEQKSVLDQETEALPFRELFLLSPQST